MGLPFKFPKTRRNITTVQIYEKCCLPMFGRFSMLITLLHLQVCFYDPTKDNYPP